MELPCFQCSALDFANCAGGSCLCSENGKDILANGRDGTCPRHLISGPIIELQRVTIPTPVSVDRSAPPATPATLNPIPRRDWPPWAEAVASRAEPEDAGIGDTVARVLGQGGRLVELAMKRLGVPCDCPERKDEWNQLFPYRKESA